MRCAVCQLFPAELGIFVGVALLVGAGSMVIAAVLVAPFGLAGLPTRMIGGKELGSVLVLGLVCTGVAYMLFFSSLRGAGASRSILVAYLVPSVALVYAVVLLGEQWRSACAAGGSR
jgi:drug/metabolite transporter (DMT)-like permease